MRSESRVLHWSWFVIGSCVWGLAANPGRTQSLGSMVDMKKAFDETSGRRGKFISGEEKPTVADKKFAEAAAEAAAKWYIFRITHRVTPMMTMATVQNELAVFAGTVDLKRKENALFVNQFLGPAMVASMRQVLATDPKENPSLLVHAAMMLPALAKVKADDIGYYLINLVQDPQTNDIVRVYALKALKEGMPVRPFEPLVDSGTKELEAKKKHDVSRVESLVKFIERPVKVNDAGEAAVVRFLRREAIVSLAHAGAPSVSLEGKGKTESVGGPVAPTLLRVLVTDGLQPPVSLQEKIEASLGLCMMKDPGFLKYDPEVAVFHVGRTASEMLSEYNKDYANFAAKDKARKLPMIAWMAESRRLELGLKEMATNAKGNGNAGKLEKMLSPILKKMQKYELPDRDQVIEFNNQLPQFRPKSGAVFKTMKSEIVPLN